MRTHAFLALLVLSGCRAAPADPAPAPQTPAAPAAAPAMETATTTATPVSAAEEDLPTKEAALAQVLATFEARGCDSAGDCRALPAGAKACGGPSRYVVYCAKTTDEALLRRTIDTYTSAERAWNTANAAVSDCAMLAPPELALTDGTCTTK